jgi:hypothetical protein
MRVFKNHCSVVSLSLALAAFVVSAAIAIFVQTYGFKYAVTSPETLESLTQEANWDRTADDARRMWVNRQAETILSLREGNNRRADLVIWSLGFEVLAIALLALSVVLELHTRFSTLRGFGPPPKRMTGRRTARLFGGQTHSTCMFGDGTHHFYYSNGEFRSAD